MNADHFFTKGKSHKVCQDYVNSSLVHQTDGKLLRSQVMLADGCSSSKDTDIGARLLVKTAEWVMDGWEFAWGREVPTPELLEHYYHQVVGHAQNTARSLRVSEEATDCTLLTLVANEHTWYTSAYGDGTILIQWKGGNLEIIEIDFPNGYPNYANYRYNPARSETFNALENSGKEIKRRFISTTEEQETISSYRDDMPVYLRHGNNDEVEWIAVLSDGVKSFAEVDRSTLKLRSLGMEEVLEELLPFKNFNGTFADRRASRFFRDITNKARPWQHDDDFSIGVIYFG